jgi:hypothetical protein
LVRRLVDKAGSGETLGGWVGLVRRVRLGWG